MKKKKKAPKGTKVSKEISFDLTEREFAEKGKTAAGLAREIGRINLEFEEVKEGFKAKIKDREGKRDDLLHVINEGKEKRVVDSIMTKDYESKLIQYWFEGRVVEERTMTETEMQLDLNLKKQKDAGKTKRQPLKLADAGIAGVIKSETNRKTKSSSVDGARA